jgi:hypothetical protein
MRAYFHSSQTALDSYSSIANQQQMQLKKSWLVLRRMVWGLTLSLVMMLSFGLAFGVTIWLKKS